AAPLRVVLPDCTGCREPSGGRSRGFSSSPPDVSRPVARRDFVRRARVLRKVVVPATIAAGVIVAIPLLVLTSSFFWSRAPRDVARVPEPPSSEIPPALPAPPLPRAPEEPLSIEAQARLQREGERREERLAPAAGQLAARIAPPSEATVAPTPPSESVTAVLAGPTPTVASGPGALSRG